MAVITDSLGRRWDPAKHPRDSKGRFIKTFGLLRLVMEGMSRAFGTGRVVSIKDENSIAVEITGVSKEYQDRIKPGTMVHVKAKNTEAINEKANISLAANTDRIGKVGVPKGLTAKYASKPERYKGSVRGFARANQFNNKEIAQVENILDGRRDVSNSPAGAYILGLHALDNTDFDDPEEVENFGNMLKSLGATDDDLDDTPDGLSGLTPILKKYNASKPDGEKKDKIPLKGSRAFEDGEEIFQNERGEVKARLDGDDPRDTDEAVLPANSPESEETSVVDFSDEDGSYELESLFDGDETVLEDGEEQGLANGYTATRNGDRIDVLDPDGVEVTSVRATNASQEQFDEAGAEYADSVRSRSSAGLGDTEQEPVADLDEVDVPEEDVVPDETPTPTPTPEPVQDGPLDNAKDEFDRLVTKSNSGGKLSREENQFIKDNFTKDDFTNAKNAEEDGYGKDTVLPEDSSPLENPTSAEDFIARSTMRGTGSEFLDDRYTTDSGHTIVVQSDMASKGSKKISILGPDGSLIGRKTSPGSGRGAYNRNTVDSILKAVNEDRSRPEPSPSPTPEPVADAPEPEPIADVDEPTTSEITGTGIEDFISLRDDLIDGNADAQPLAEALDEFDDSPEGWNRIAESLGRINISDKDSGLLDRIDRLQETANRRGGSSEKEEVADTGEITLSPDILSDSRNLLRDIAEDTDNPGFRIEGKKMVVTDRDRARAHLDELYEQADYDSKNADYDSIRERAERRKNQLGVLRDELGGEPTKPDADAPKQSLGSIKIDRPEAVRGLEEASEVATDDGTDIGWTWDGENSISVHHKRDTLDSIDDLIDRADTSAEEESADRETSRGFERRARYLRRVKEQVRSLPDVPPKPVGNETKETPATDTNTAPEKPPTAKVKEIMDFVKNGGDLDL